MIGSPQDGEERFGGTTDLLQYRSVVSMSFTLRRCFARSALHIAGARDALARETRWRQVLGGGEGVG